MRAAIYTRISLDPDHDSWSPDRQEALCRQRAVGLGHEVVAVYTDRGASAWKPRVKRPGWEALKESVCRGEVEVVIAYSLTRLERRVRDLLDLSDFLTAHRCGLVVADMNLDTTTAGGKLIYTMIAAMAQMESEQISQRVKSAQKVKADRGRMHTGGNRQFGYGVEPTADTKEARQLARETINEEEAKELRDLADRVLSGISLRKCAAEWNAKGLRTTAGSEWTGRTIAQALKSPRIAGLRTHKGTMLPGNWEPILSEEVWLQIRGVIDARPGTGGGINTRRHLLSGIARCGRCESNMVAHFSNGRGRGTMDRYTCPKNPGRPGCGRLAASKSSVERFVINQFFDFMSNAELQPVDGDERSLAEVRADITKLESALTDLARARFVDNSLSDEQFGTVNREQSARLEALRRVERATADRLALQRTVLRPGVREDIVAWWEAASLRDQRVALQRAISHVVINPARVRGGNIFDTSRVNINWRWDVYVRASDAAWERMTDGEREQAEVEAQQEIEAVLELERAGSSSYSA